MTNEMLNNFKRVLVETGRMAEDDKLNLVEISGNAGSDYRTVVLEITKKRCRKPYMVWDLYVNMVRELVFFDRSHFEYL